MASLKKRGKYYYIKFSKMVDGEVSETVKSLGITRRSQADEALETLERLEEQGVINPYRNGFDPVLTLKQLNSKEQEIQASTVREAADHFYKKKSHLSNSTVKNADNRTIHNSGAYEQAIEHFITLNDIADLSPLMIKKHHFENVIFKPGIKPATRHFYFKQLRVWWNKLLEWKIVEHNYFPAIKKDLPKIKKDTLHKMLTERELDLLFQKFDEELERKRKRKEYDEDQTQWWFKPLIAVYFYCGLRKHEAAYKSDLEYSGLQGKNLHFEDGKLEMIYLSSSKGPLERAIPVPKACQKYIHEYLERRGRVGYEDYLFIYQGGRRKGFPVTGARAYRQFKHYVKLTDGIPNSRTLHGMRHEWFTRKIENGYSVKETQFMGGHSSVSQTEEYVHLKGLNLLKKQRKIDNNSQSE